MSETLSGSMTPSRSGTLDRRDQRPSPGVFASTSTASFLAFASMFRVWQPVSCEDTGDVAAAVEKQLKRWARQKMLILIESASPKWRTQGGEGRRIAPGGARSLHFGRDDTKKERPRAALAIVVSV